MTAQLHRFEIPLEIRTMDYELYLETACLFAERRKAIRDIHAGISVAAAYEKLRLCRREELRRKSRTLSR